MISYNIMVSVEIMTCCSYDFFTAKFVQVVKIYLFSDYSRNHYVRKFYLNDPCKQ
jgi:hypothetical protein